MIESKKNCVVGFCLSALSIFSFLASANAKAMGCGGFDVTIRSNHYEARTQINPSEDCSVGTYRVMVKTPDGKVSNFSAERDGWIKQMWFQPLGENKQPSVVLWIQSSGTGSYGELAVYKPDAKNHYALEKIAPLPTSIKGYEGQDSFMVEGGDIFRSFPDAQAMPIKMKDGTTQCPKGNLSFHYDFQKKTWVSTN